MIRNQDGSIDKESSLFMVLSIFDGELHPLR